MKQDKFLYFRAQATDADDDSGSDSACYPVSSLMGMIPTNDTSLTLYFKPMKRGVPGGNELDDATNFDNYDVVLVSIPNNTHLKAMKAIVQAINDYRNTIIIVANDDSDGTEYLANSGITGCALISINATYDNS
tara:strand:- start:487 stop:888 length:402 start_codon:yes stop_codon:yes gene_type:complete